MAGDQEKGIRNITQRPDVDVHIGFFRSETWDAKNMKKYEMGHGVPSAKKVE